jgi:hypothetical protein
MESIPAGRFKDCCLKTLHEVASTQIGRRKHGRPVARLVPYVQPA